MGSIEESNANSKRRKLPTSRWETRAAQKTRGKGGRYRGNGKTNNKPADQETPRLSGQVGVP